MSPTWSLEYNVPSKQCSNSTVSKLICRLPLQNHLWFHSCQTTLWFGNYARLAPIPTFTCELPCLQIGGKKETFGHTSSNSNFCCLMKRRDWFLSHANTQTAPYWSANTCHFEITAMPLCTHSGCYGIPCKHARLLDPHGPEKKQNTGKTVWRVGSQRFK